jgi:hypothetical protein
MSIIAKIVISLIELGLLLTKQIPAFCLGAILVIVAEEIIGKIEESKC